MTVGESNGELRGDLSGVWRRFGTTRRSQPEGPPGLPLRSLPWRFTALSATPFSGYRFPPAIIALAIRWYLRYRLSYADMAELLAERGARVDPSTIFAWVRGFAPLYEDIARSFRHAISER